MLKILLPTIFPTAISEFFFIAAVTEVNNSGKDVPKATIVNPMNLSLKPKTFSTYVAELTTQLLLATIKTNPITVKISAFGKERFLISSDSSLCDEISFGLFASQNK